MKKIAFLLLLILHGMFPSYANMAGGWSLDMKKDELDGSVRKWGQSESLNSLRGWVKDDMKVLLMYPCDTNSLMFFSPGKFEAEYTRGSRKQDVRIKIDDNPVVRTSLRVSDTRGSLVLFDFHSHYDDVMKQVASGAKMRVEVELFNTGIRQIADFRVDGFNEVVDWCNDAQS